MRSVGDPGPITQLAEDGQASPRAARLAGTWASIAVHPAEAVQGARDPGGRRVRGRSRGSRRATTARPNSRPGAAPGCPRHGAPASGSAAAASPGSGMRPARPARVSRRCAGPARRARGTRPGAPPSPRRPARPPSARPPAGSRARGQRVSQPRSWRGPTSSGSARSASATYHAQCRPAPPPRPPRAASPRVLPQRLQKPIPHLVALFRSQDRATSPPARLQVQHRRSRTDDESGLPSSSKQTASAASRVQPPANTARRRQRVRSGSSSRSWLQSISARKVR